MTNKTKIYADGDNVILMFSDGTSELAYTLRSPVITDLNVDLTSDVTPTGLASRESLFTINSNQHAIINVNMVVPNQLSDGSPGYIVESSDEIGKILVRNDLFKNVSVKDLFAAINRKLKQRENKR